MHTIYACQKYHTKPSPTKLKRHSSGLVVHLTVSSIRYIILLSTGPRARAPEVVCVWPGTDDEIRLADEDEVLALSLLIRCLEANPDHRGLHPWNPSYLWAVLKCDLL